MKQSISIIGGGTASLMLAAFLDSRIFDITIYEQKSSLGRKFLVAGDGGFNLTHSETIEHFKQRYYPNEVLDKALDEFNNEDFRAWLDQVGIPTFVGSSKRVFPKRGIKPIEVLKAIETYLVNKGVRFEFNKRFVGWKADKTILFDDNVEVTSDINVFALGGGSWKVTGSDGHWLSTFSQAGIPISPFFASNCAFAVDWPADLLANFVGTPFKNIAICHEGSIQTGEVVMTKLGLEGNAIYALSQPIQTQLKQKGQVLIHMDFKPMFSPIQLFDKLNKSKYNTTKTLKDIIKLSPLQIAMLRTFLTKEDYLDSEVLASKISRFPITIVGSAPLDEAISTSGGLRLDAIDNNYQLINKAQQYCIGEMLAWDAPTGGYLIQACASMGVHLARILNGDIEL